ncbi:MAG: sulfotransferase [Actinobacteria bacterium]|nr:MAG: sulfotransferase [Actinomycetota bacterium]
MTWRPPPRPEWVQAVNAGHVLPIADEARLPLRRDDLLAEARATLGIDGRGADGFGDDGFLEPLAVLLPALGDEAELSLLGRWITRRFLLRLLEVRAQTVAYVRADPGVRDEEIREPVFITGAPRSGTTVMHALLARQPGTRVPEGWELLRPVPPPDPAQYPDAARVALADRELRRPALVVSGLDAIHEYGGRMQKECVSAMSFEFRSEEFTARYRVPSYVEWLGACDMRPAYEWHRLLLQILQRRNPTARWMLKSPVHLHSLPTLLAVYPDARLVCTHRDPLAVLGSVSSLVATMRYAHSDLVDFAGIGAYHAELYGGALDGLVDLAAGKVLDADRVHHTRYESFMRDPFVTTRTLFDALDWPLTDETEDAIHAHLVDNPRGAKGEHRYSFDDLGLDHAAERKRFARYQEYFGVPNEDGS